MTFCSSRSIMVVWNRVLQKLAKYKNSIIECWDCVSLDLPDECIRKGHLKLFLFTKKANQNDFTSPKKKKKKWESYSKMPTISFNWYQRKYQSYINDRGKRQKSMLLLMIGATFNSPGIQPNKTLDIDVRSWIRGKCHPGSRVWNLMLLLSTL